MCDNIPLKEYPRPQFKRDSFLNLNGLWDFEILKNDSFINDFKSKILVPYCVESTKSRITKRITKNDFLHYRKTFEIPSDFNKGKIILNFGAVDQISKLYINRKFVGENKGGYLPFNFDITDFLKDGENEIYLIVQDNTDSDIYAKGKQVSKPKGIYYTPMSGIWQTVFLESVPKTYIKKISISTEYDERKVIFNYESDEDINDLKVEISFQNKIIETIKPKGKTFEFSFNLFESWSPENPNLYYVKFSYAKDEITTYFGMRKFSIITNKNNHKLFALNNKPILLKGVLDQGYFLDGICTPNENSDLENDVKTMKSMGFNMLRKHIKIELPLFYYYCDKLGIIVWQDFVNGGFTVKPLYAVVRPFLGLKYDDTNYSKLGRKNEKSRMQFVQELKETYSYLKDFTCIGGWTIFNEGWGQFDSIKNTEILKNLETTRFIDSCSGWYDQGAGDCDSKHIYFVKLKMKNTSSRVLFLSEFGGYSLHLKGHTFSPKHFGYKKFKNSDDLFGGLKDLFLKQLLPCISEQDLGGFVYTQLSDVETEVNGLITYDRKIIKIKPEKIKFLNDKLEESFKNNLKNI